MSSHDFFFFNDTATTEIYTLSLHDALPIYLLLLEQLAAVERVVAQRLGLEHRPARRPRDEQPEEHDRSEEHTSELQSRQYLVCRLLLEKKKSLRSILLFILQLCLLLAVVIA